MDRLVHHLVYTSLSATKPITCEETFEAAQERAREYLNGHAVLFISGVREIDGGERDLGISYRQNFACPVCSRPVEQFARMAEQRRRRYARGTGMISGTQLPPGEYRATINRD